MYSETVSDDNVEIARKYLFSTDAGYGFTDENLRVRLVFIVMK